MPMFRIEWVEHKYGEVWATDLEEAKRIAVIPDLRTEASLRHVTEIDPFTVGDKLEAIGEEDHCWIVWDTKGNK